MQKHSLTWVIIIQLLWGVTAWGKDTLVVAIEAAPKTLTPFHATDANGVRIVQHLIYETLLQQNTALEVVPALAERWEVFDGLRYRFFLRNNAVFSNGRPVDAKAVKASFEWVLDAQHRSPYRALYHSKIKKIRTIDAMTIEFELFEPQASFLVDLIFPVAYVDSSGDKPQYYGSGPFVLQKQSPAAIRLSRNPHHPEKPSIQTIDFKVIKDDQTRYLKMVKGGVDIAMNAIPINKLAFFNKAPLSRKYHVEEAPGLSYQYLGFNLRHPILKKVEVRRAIAHTIQREELIQFFKKNHAFAADSILMPQSIFYSKPTTAFSHDLQKAAKLLDAAGYPLKDGVRFSLEYKTSTNPEAINQARILQSQLKKVGIVLNIRSFEWGLFYADLLSGNFEIFSSRWVGITDADFLYSLFHSSQTPPTGRNRGTYQNPKIDPLLEAGRVAMDLEKRKAIYAEIQQILAEDLPYISLWHNHNVAILKKSLQGFQLHPSGGFQSFPKLSFK